MSKRKVPDHCIEEHVLLSRSIKFLIYNSIDLGNLSNASYILDSLNIQSKNEVIKSFNNRYLDRDPMIFVAIEKNCIKTVNFLIKNGVDIEIFNNQGLNPVQAALNQKIHNNELIRILLNQNFDTNIIDIEQRTGDETTLHTASRTGNLEIVVILLNKGAEINVIDSYGDTPTHESVYCNNIDIARFLILNGADIHIKNELGLTAYDIAKKKKYFQIEKDLIITTAIEKIFSINEEQITLNLNTYYEIDKKWFTELLEQKLLDKFKSSTEVLYIQNLMKIIHHNLIKSDLCNNNLIDILDNNKIITHIYKRYDEFLDSEILSLEYIAILRFLDIINLDYDFSVVPDHVIDILKQEIDLRTNKIWDDHLEDTKTIQDQFLIIGESK